MSQQQIDRLFREYNAMHPTAQIARIGDSTKGHAFLIDEDHWRASGVPATPDEIEDIERKAPEGALT